MDMRFGFWNIKRLCRAGSLVTVSKELSIYKLDIVGVQEVSWEAVAPNRQKNTHFSMGKGMGTMN
jgi:hypothetical protein